MVVLHPNSNKLNLSIFYPLAHKIIIHHIIINNSYEDKAELTG